MTTPNTEPKPATDAEISGIAAWNCDCRFQAGKDRHTRECLMVFGPRLVARIEQEREMRRKLAAVLKEIRRIKPDLGQPYCAYCGGHEKHRAGCHLHATLARTAKMEGPNAR